MSNQTSTDVINVMLATGGSGGHIYPAVSIAQELKTRGYNLAFVGQASGMEARIVPEAGYEFHGVSAGKIQRKLLNLGIFKELFSSFKGFAECIALLRSRKPELVIGFGGFASFPTVAAAWLLRVPYVLHEANAYPGLVTRLFARHAKLVLLANKEAKNYLKNAKTDVVPVPIREGRVSRAEARQALNISPDAFVTFVMGGSQGSAVLNSHVPQAFENMNAKDNEETVDTPDIPDAAIKNHVVIHSAGRDRSSEVSSPSENYRVEDYVDSSLVWAAADVGITRAGNGTLSEAAYHGVPLIMVPLPSAAENHQFHNAQAVEAAGAGVVLEEKELREDYKSLTKVWKALARAEHNHQASLAAKVRSPEGAAKKLIDILEASYLEPKSGNPTPVFQ